MLRRVVVLVDRQWPPLLVGVLRRARPAQPRRATQRGTALATARKAGRAHPSASSFAKPKKGVKCAGQPVFVTKNTGP
jgi:hypothetical protein